MGVGYPFNVKITALASGITYQLLFWVAGVDAGSTHADAHATFALNN